MTTRSSGTRKPVLRRLLPVLMLIPGLLVSLPQLATAKPAHAASGPMPFLWGAATSSYQVEGGINCLQPGPGNPWTNLGSPCNDYDFFFGNGNVQARVANNTGLVGPEIDLENAGEADKFWDPAYYERDFDNARLLGMNSFRISLEWGRIEPQPGTFDATVIQHYRTMLQEMRKRGLRPVVTLHHFTLPIWALTPSERNGCVVLCQPVDDTGYLSSMRGWEDYPSPGMSQTLDAYVDYVKHVVPALKDLVDVWLTVNEPVLSQAVVGYIAGVWPGGYVLDGGRTKQVLRNLILAHVRAYDIIKDCQSNPLYCDDKEADGPAMVGFAHAMSIAVPVFDPNPAQQVLNNQAAINYDYFGNDYFVNAVVDGNEDVGYLNNLVPVPGSNVVHHNDWAGHLDFLGINYYRRFHVSNDPVVTAAGVGFVGGATKNNLYGEGEPHNLLNDMGWEVYPRGLYDLVMRAKNKWNMPVLVTENGIPERSDRNRAAFIVAHVRALQQAIHDGATVLGYMYWSLIDNWELQSNYAHESQFGLFHIYSGGGTPGERATLPLHRELTEGALAYQQLVEESRATSSLGAPTEPAVNSASAKFGEIKGDGSSVIAPVRSSGRYWQGNGVYLYLSYVEETGALTGMIGFGGPGTLNWNRVDLLRDSSGLVLRESYFDDAAGVPATRDHHVTYSNGAWSGTYNGGSWSAIQLPAAGLWNWTSSSPWGGTQFAIGLQDGRYTGKYMTFPWPVIGGLGAEWRDFGGISPGATFRLQGGDTTSTKPVPDLDIFDVTVKFTGSSAQTVAAHSGTFAVQKATNAFTVGFGHTNYTAPAGDITWGGQRDETPDSKFNFLENGALDRVFPASPPNIPGCVPLGCDQYNKEHDPSSVMPVANFIYTPLEIDLGVVTKASVSWEMGGRSYSLTAGLGVCAYPLVCNGTWSDVGGKNAARVSERFPPFVDMGGDRTVEANTSGGANVQLDASGSFDLDGALLTYTWTGDFGTASGAQPTIFLALDPSGKPATHQVCVRVSNGVTSASRCANITIADTLSPVVTCAAPDGKWHATDARLACTAADIGSGLTNSADSTFSLSTSVPAGTETANAATGSRTVCDRAGNCAVAGPIAGNRVDKKAPQVTIVQPTASDYPHSATMTLDYSVADGGSGLARFTPYLDGATTLDGHGLQPGQSINLLTELSLGTHTFRVDAVDNVGNSGSVNVTFNVVVTPGSIKDDVNQLAGTIKNTGLKTSLLGKLDAAADKRAAGDCAAASAIYQSFINEVNAQSGQGIDPAAASILVADAQYLIAHCP